MSVYLHDIPLKEAQKRIWFELEKAGLLSPLGSEEVPLDETSVGRVLAEPIWAKISSPHYHAAAMDGFAIRAKDTEGALATEPVTLQFGEFCSYIDTGDPLPTWANAVIPIEHVEPLNGTDQPAENPREPICIRIRSSIPPWRHVRAMGEDIVVTELVLPGGHTLRPVDLGAIAACGYRVLLVQRKPRITILPTGSELVEIGNSLQPGDIIEYNSVVLAAQVNLWGGQAVRYPIIKDQFQVIKQQVQNALEESDLILLNAGSSAGSEDFSAPVINDLGKLIFHGVAVRPGHPVIFGMIPRDESGKHGSIPIFGVPGYPVSAALTAEVFIQPILNTWLGRFLNEPDTIQAKLTRKVTSPPGDDDYVRVVVGKVGSRTMVTPISSGAGVISSLVRADGIAIIPRGSEGYPAGTEISVNLYRPVSQIEKAIFVTGSHDIGLDVLAQHLSAFDRRLVSANVGSLGGLLAIQRSETHLAGSHLLAPESGEYNIRYVREYLPGVPVKVVRFVRRQQGLLLQTGNPSGIKTLADIVKRKLVYINRQRGSGTRVLLDYQLDLLGIPPSEIIGYDEIEFTHLGVAAAIASGRAECGLGIPAAATGLNLDFIPLYSEEYDLIIPSVHYEDKLLEPLLTLLNERSFQRDIERLPGYDTAEMGKIKMTWSGDPAS